MFPCPVEDTLINNEAEQIFSCLLAICGLSFLCVDYMSEIFPFEMQSQVI